MRDPLKPFLLTLACCCSAVLAEAQTALFFQGFEAGTVCNGWSFTGGTGNTTTARTGTSSCRVGALGETSSVTFNTVDVTGMANVQLSFYHSVRAGAGFGMDTREGVTIQVQVNGGAWTTMAQMTGFSDSNWAWVSPTGGTTTVSTGCNGYTAPNPFVYSPPIGTNTLAFRVVSVGNNAGTCGTFNANLNAPNASSFDRADEGFYIDDVKLTTTTTPVPAIWTGATGTDWHTCTNWLYGSVPTSMIPTTIDQRAVSDCVISTAAANCKSLVISSNNGTSRNLTIQGGRKLTVANDATITRTSAGPELGITLLTSPSAQFECANLTITGSSAGARNAALRNESNLNTALVKGNLVINAGGLLDLQGAAAGGTMQLQGNYANNDQESAFDEQFSTFQFQGTVAQSISTAGFEERFGNFRMGKTSNDLTLNAPVSVRAALTWTSNGIVFSTSTNLFTLEAGSSATGMATSRFISGPVRKLGNTDFIFPIGKGTSWRSAQVTGITNSASGFTAEYFPASPQATFGNARDASLHHVSDCEYWTLTRSAGADDVYFWLSWATPNSCGVTSLPEMRTAYWNGSQWVDRGNGAVTGTTASGSVRTEDVQSVFGSFTLASSSAENPLPIQLLDFNAVASGTAVQCDWTTATERDNDHFTIERSTDAVAFDPVGTVQAIGNSQEMVHYGFTDAAPLEGLSYYRLRQTDVDGATTVTGAVPVLFRKDVGISVSPEGLVLHDFPAGSRYEVFDADGRAVLLGRAEADAFRLPLGAAGGLYLLRLSDGERSRTVRFAR